MRYGIKIHAIMDAGTLLALVREIVKDPDREPGGIKWKCRVKASFEEVSSWCNWWIVPAKSYNELEYAGPISEKDIQWIDIDPVVSTKRGRLVPDSREDKKDQLISALTEQGILFEDRKEFLRVVVADNAKRIAGSFN